MNRFFTILLAASCLTAVGQVTYPYNPDGNADGDIAVGDLQDFLVTYGNPFSPSEIMVGDSSLTYWVEQLSQTIQEQQEMIELLQYRNSKNLAFPDGFGGDFIVLNISNEDFTVPQDKNFFITNQYSQNALPRITVDDIPVFEVDGGTLATSQFGSGSTYIVGGGSVLGYSPIVNASPVVNFSGILVDRGVEPIIVDLLQEDFAVPQGYNLHLMSVYSEGSGSGFAQVDGVELFRMGSNSTMWQNLIGGQIIASGNQTVSLVSTGNLELANLSCYLAPIDHFSGPNNLGDFDDSSASDNSGPCQGEFTVNYHGYDYELVEIGNQCWFAENLRYLPQVVTSPALSSQGSESGAEWPYSYVYGYQSNSYQSAVDEMSMNNLGALYNLNAVIFWNLCPSGWHIPSDSEWMTLETYAGMDPLQLEQSNWRGTEEEVGLHLRSVDWGGYDTFGFNIVPSGIREAQEFRHGPTTDEPFAVFLTSSWSSPSSGSSLGRAVGGDNSGIWKGPLNPDNGNSIRCIKDSE